MKILKNVGYRLTALICLLLIIASASAADWVKVEGVTLKLSDGSALREMPGNENATTETVEITTYDWLYSDAKSEILKKVARQANLSPDPDTIKQREATITSPSAKESMAGTLAGARFMFEKIPEYRQRFGTDLSEKNKATFFEDIKTSAAEAKVSKEEMVRVLDMAVPDNGNLEKFEKVAGYTVDQALRTASSGTHEIATFEAAEKHLAGPITVTPEEMKRGREVYKSRGIDDENGLFDKWIQSQKRYYLVRKEILKRLKADAEFSGPEFRKKAFEQWSRYYDIIAPIFEPQ